MTKQDRFWTDYYALVCNDGPGWVDYSNERVHIQTLAATLDATDRFAGRSVLDVGCGQGQLCRMAMTMGATPIVGIDLASESVQRLTNTYPQIQWVAGDFNDPNVRSGLATYDLVYLVEILQFLPVPEALDWVWKTLNPGGRLVAMFPFEGCPIVERTSARFDGRYVPPSVQAVVDWCRQSPIGDWAIRGLAFRDDQAIAPYNVLAWTQDPSWATPPNRIQLAFQKPEEGPGSRLPRQS